jgi:hypothetical protein
MDFLSMQHMSIQLSKCPEQCFSFCPVMENHVLTKATFSRSSQTMGFTYPALIGKDLVEVKAKGVNLVKKIFTKSILHSLIKQCS